METPNINQFLKTGRAIGGQNAYQLKHDGFIDSSFNFLQTDEIQLLVEKLENSKSYFVYEGEELHFVGNGERLNFEFINVIQTGNSVRYTMAYRQN